MIEDKSILLTKPIIRSLFERSLDVSTKKINHKKAAIPKIVNVKANNQYRSAGNGGLKAINCTLVISLKKVKILFQLSNLTLIQRIYFEIIILRFSCFSKQASKKSFRISFGRKKSNSFW